MISRGPLQVLAEHQGSKFLAPPHSSMNRSIFSRALSLGAAALALPCLLTACSSQAQEPANSASPTVADAPAPTTATSTNSTASATEGTTPEASPVATASDTAADAASKPSYKVDHQAPPGMTEAQMKKIWVPTPPASFALGAKPRVRLVTSKGAIVVALDPKAAPLHAKSFVYLAKRGYFDGTLFHRWADLTGAGGAIIQGGDPLSRDPKTRPMAGMGGPGYSIPREHNSLKHDALVIAAARSSDPDSAGSQFYIIQAPTYFLDEGDGYTVFGKVTEGGDVAKKLRQDDKIIKAQVLK